jgi:hypothetical protein
MVSASSEDNVHRVSDRDELAPDVVTLVVDDDVPVAVHDTEEVPATADCADVAEVNVDHLRGERRSPYQHQPSISQFIYRWLRSEW